MKNSFKDIIYFFHPSDDYGYLSNFYRMGFILDGVMWPSSEHYYQSKKFEGTSFEATIRDALTPGQAARLGRGAQLNVRKDWDDVKISVMRVAIAAKFVQNGCLRQRLIETGQAIIVEHCSKDAFWGDGGDGSGKNVLGALLMTLRTRLSNDVMPGSVG